MKAPPTLLISVDKLDKHQATVELEYLAYIIAKYNHAYYIEDKPLVSDAEYDSLFSRNIDLEQQFPELKRPDSPSVKVGSDLVRSGFVKQKHMKPMLSINTCFSIDEVKDFIKSTKSFLGLKDDAVLEFMCEPKIDGLSFNALYEGGKLAHVATRGDGTVGEDITPNVKTIKSFPQQINTHIKQIEIRGELFITHAEFARINKERESQGLVLFANARNAAAGSVRQLDASITRSRNMDYIAYAAGYQSEPLGTTQSGLLTQLAKLGFKTSELNRKVSSIDEIEQYHEHIYDIRASIPYDIDGVVYKVNDFGLQSRLGFISRAPRFELAHKFPPKQAKTIIKSITVQVGRTGALTPVAELEPINIGGVMVKRATLHNQDEIARKDIRIGGTVVVERSGDVIPNVLSVDLKLRPTDSHKFTLPEKCPVCGSAAVREQDEAVLRCTGDLKCEAQRLEHLRYFASQDALNIVGLGEKQIEFLYSNGYIKTPVDIFHLKDKAEQLSTHDGWGERSISNLLAAIEKARNVPLDRFINALGIRHVGERMAKLIAAHVHTFSEFYALMTEAQHNDESLRSIAGVGDVVISSLELFFKEPYNRRIVSELGQELHIADYTNVATNSALSNQKIVFTGTLVKMQRREAKARAESLGAQVLSQVSAQADLVVAGSDAGSKLNKAKELGIRIIDEDEWLQMISQ